MKKTNAEHPSSAGQKNRGASRHGTRSHKSNRLLQVLILLSIIVHAPICMHIAGVYRSEALSYIEFTLKDVSKPFVRSIPRARQRTKAPEIKDVKRLTIRQPRIPAMNIKPIDANLPDSLMESIGVPDLDSEVGVGLADLGNSGYDLGGTFLTKNDYFELVRIKIESKKKYPALAKSRQVEGLVKVKFVITADGNVSSLGTAESGKEGSLDEAALAAVRNAAPFPPPPRNLFSGPVAVEITIRFELT